MNSFLEEVMKKKKWKVTFAPEGSYSDRSAAAGKVVVVVEKVKVIRDGMTRIHSVESGRRGCIDEALWHQGIILTAPDLVLSSSAHAKSVSVD